MIAIEDVRRMDFDGVPIDEFWNAGDGVERKMHRIHAYPAKFPAFITTKALGYAREQRIKTRRIADVFCGCGTVAYEAKRNLIDFWGCDINPVATLIAEAKSRKYQTHRLEHYLDAILETFPRMDLEGISYKTANPRLKYWYKWRAYNDLVRLKVTIETVLPKSGGYRKFFLCAFSNILKPTSRWLTKSIKPQVDPDKKPAKVLSAFKEQCRFMINANSESDLSGDSRVHVVTRNFLDPSLDCPRVDMIVTSPPYVTSYEYADLHQLSSLWLDYAVDYRDLRKGSIGSLQHAYDFERELKRLNGTGGCVVFRLLEKDRAIARSVAKYFLDMQQVAKRCQKMLAKGGMALFVIGDTEYRGVRVENARHMVESLLEVGFSSVHVTKRKISKKILTPYRDEEGRFSSDADGRKIYSEEFILVGRK